MAELAAGAAPSHHLGDHSDRPQDDEWEQRFSLESISLEELWNPLIQTPLGLYSVS